MPDIIQLLPDHLANQIAAGEVIQRPASVVKELLENAIDAGATDIQLIIKDAGKELIQVVDNGKGMSPMDARMSFERHATSKIKQIDDLFAIRTMGFRGEALASIAAVAQVDLKTKTEKEEAGTHILIEASEVKKQEPTATDKGTNLSVKNLFYNIPARRKFLKSNTAEYRHIVDEFTRVAMAYPGIAFRLFHNNTPQFHLISGNVKNRIVELLGNRVEKQLIPLQQDTDLLNIYGFIGKPEAATRTRGNQFIFINNRFIRNAYLNHAVATAYEGLIEKAAYPFYVLFFDLDPQRVDVNVHPSKQEVKFDDERILYAYLQSAVKQALAQNNVAPSIDFSIDESIQRLEAIQLPQSGEQKANAGSGYLQHSFSEKGKAFFLDKNSDMQQWQQQKKHFFPEMPSATNTSTPQHKEEKIINTADTAETPQQQIVFQWREYLVSTIKSGLLLIHHSRAMERILYERMMLRIEKNERLSQQMLFPAAYEASPQDVHLMEELLPQLAAIGFEIHSLGKNTYSVNGTPPDISPDEAQSLIESILDDMKKDVSSSKNQHRERALLTTVKKIRKPKHYNTDEAQALIDELFACSQPQYTPDGQPVYTVLAKGQIDNFF